MVKTIILMSINLKVVTFVHAYSSAITKTEARLSFVIVSSVDLPFKQLNIIKMLKCHQQKGKQ